MREILFRGKSLLIDLQGSTFVYGCLIIEKGIQFIKEIDKPFGEIDYHQIIPETLGQFTGLLDKNGNKIFEGDIVQSESCLLEIGIDEYGTYTTTRLSNNVTFTDFLINDYENGNLEVIGNIHENPELLGGAK